MAEPSAARLPEKLYFRIGEVAELVGVEPHVLRYWEREFRTIRPTKSAKGQRVYSRRDVENLMRVRELLYKEGFTIAGAKKKLVRVGLDVDEEGDNRPDESAAQPQGQGPSEADAVRAHEQLLAMRQEIESFLAEIDLAAR
jgi:DNA-binding transcriptional MerR regulator